MARRGCFSSTFNGVRYLLFALGVLLLIGSSGKTDGQASDDLLAFAWFCVVVGFPFPLLVLPFRFVVWLLGLFGIGKRKPQAAPYTMQAGEVALAFRVGNRYYDAGKNRVFECIALKGKKARLAAFACLDSVEKELAFLKECPELGRFHKVRTDGGVETCQRGALRADRQATEKEIADELEFLRQLRKREAEYKPSGAVQVSVTIGDKTYTSG